MPQLTVAAVMTRTVVTAMPDTPFRELIHTMLDHGVSAVPVINCAGRPIGIVAETDALSKLEYHGGAGLPPLLATRPTRRRWHQSSALIAADLMTTPAPTAAVDTPLTAAVCRLARGQARGLCVVDPEGYLVGVVAIRDLLRVFLRSDADLRADIERDLPRGDRGLLPITVHVHHAEATLDGTLTFRSWVEHAGYLAHAAPGVITVHNNLRYQVDDLATTGL